MTVCPWQLAARAPAVLCGALKMSVLIKFYEWESGSGGLVQGQLLPPDPPGQVHTNPLAACSKKDLGA